MPEYRRAFQPGGMFFFTVVTYVRRPIFSDPTARACLRNAFDSIKKQWPFEMPAIVLLPDHLHCVWQLPDEDHDFSIRWANIKREFTSRWLVLGGRQASISVSREKHREKGVWQRRFWEHTLGDERDLILHLHYIHYNPVKHGLATCPHTWPYSSFARHVEQHLYESDWQCTCEHRIPKPLDFYALDQSRME